MIRRFAPLIAAVTVNLVAAIALTFVTSLMVAWVLFSVICTATAVTLYGVWRVAQETRMLAVRRGDARPTIRNVDTRDRAPEFTERGASGGASNLDRHFRCSVSDKVGLLVTYAGPDSCELFRLLTVIREFRQARESLEHPSP